MYCAALLLMCLSYSAAQAPQDNMYNPDLSPGCLLNPVPYKPEWFQVNIPNYGSKRFPCPMNTLFDVTQCGCGWVDNPINPPDINNGYRPSGPDEVIPTTEFQTTTRPPCKLRRTRDRHYYEQFIVGFDWLLRRCPMGTLYNEEACACHDIDPNQQIMCHPELWLNFNDRDLQDSSGYQIAVGSNGNVQNVSNAGRFDGTGTLTVWQYSNQDLGTEITINLRFYEYMSKEASDEQILISNCYGRQLGSVEIAINQINKEVIFRGDATLSEPAEVRLPYQEKSWKNVTLTYNGQELTGQVDNEIKSVPLKGHLSLRNHGFLIGSCNGRGYVGYIDDLRIYRCLLDGTGYSYGGFGGMGAVETSITALGPGMGGR